MNRCSVWFGFDVDRFSACHKQGKSKATIDKLIRACKPLPYLHIARSRSGAGYHLFARVDGLTAKNRREHYDNRKRVKQKISDDIGIDLTEVADKQQAGVLFIFSAVKKKNGFKIVKKATAALKDADLPTLKKISKATSPGRKAPTVCESFDIEEWFAKHKIGFTKEWDEERQSTRYRTQPRCLLFRNDKDGATRHLGCQERQDHGQLPAPKMPRQIMAGRVGAV